MRTISFFLILIPLFTLAQEPTKEQIQQVKRAKKEVKKMKGDRFPDFELTTLDGEKISSQELNDKYILFNFWFTSCGPCIQEMPELNELVEEFKEEEVIFLAPTFNTTSQVNKFLNRFNFDYQIIPDVKDFCLELNIRSYPTHFIVSPEGVIEKVMIGYSPVTVNSFRKSLNKLLVSKG